MCPPPAWATLWTHVCTYLLCSATSVLSAEKSPPSLPSLGHCREWGRFSPSSLLQGGAAWPTGVDSPGTHGSLENWAGTAGLRKGNYKISQDQLIVPERKEMLEQSWGYVQRSQEPTWKSFQQPKVGSLSNKINNKWIVTCKVKWMYFAKWKKPDPQSYMLYESTSGHSGKDNTTTLQGWKTDQWLSEIGGVWKGQQERILGGDATTCFMTVVVDMTLYVCQNP